ncbi:hypothetical protein [Paraurantiacibacter namhicola]|uniref:Uncharacterized protein n=1 Tax=Paraurantiacibacter namhicola TaxID=645517 RepID=A0A1C7D6Q7_9SPHN|nr:hypothetical protein [Paraurantiacibacter namhicola]ANU07149.1 hypothetical protein A6F65_00831 [Paraurantiacibacter namhicola]
MGRLGFGYGARHRRRALPGGSGVVAAPPPTIEDNGWSVRLDSPQDLSMQPLAVQRQGFSASGAPASHAATTLLTKRVREAWPDHAQDTPGRVALSDYLYATDAVAGWDNASTAAAPKPIAAWTMPAREIVGAALAWELVAFHRDARPDPVDGTGRQVACVRVRASNGAASTAWQVVSQTGLSALCEDRQPLETYSGTLDVSALPDGPVWLEAEVVPWFGAEASVLRSEDNAAPREFSRRWFRKDVARAANPPVVYLSSTGSDATGVVSADNAAALAAPCLTLAGAFTRARSQLGAATGSFDGLRIRVLDRVRCGAIGWQPFYPQDIAAVIVERAPGTAREAAILEWNASLRTYFKDHSTGLSEGALTFRDLTIARTGPHAFYGEAAAQLEVRFHDVVFDNAGHAGSWRANSHISVHGMQMTGYNNNLLQTSAGELRMLRGLDADMAGGGPEAWVTLGSRMTNAGACRVADPAKGALFYGNEWRSPAAVTGTITFAGSVAGQRIGPVAIVQNLIEVTHTEASAAAFVLASVGLGDVSHAVMFHNCGTGEGQLGRWNICYDEHPAATRTHTLVRYAGNLCEQFNTKGDIFQQDGSRLGQFPLTHGVGCSGNFTVSLPNAPSSEAQTYPGPGSLIGAGDPGFVQDRSTSGTAEAPMAGAGGGDYALIAASPARGIQPDAVLAFDLAGNPRGNGPQAAGPYA